MAQPSSIRPTRTTIPIRSMLQEGQGRISVGRAEEVAALVQAEPKRFSQLVECLWDEDPGVVNRAAHALERLTRDVQPRPIAQLNSWNTPCSDCCPTPRKTSSAGISLSSFRASH
jgi:hypothetical protein